MNTKLYVKLNTSPVKIIIASSKQDNWMNIEENRKWYTDIYNRHTFSSFNLLILLMLCSVSLNVVADVGLSSDNSGKKAVLNLDLPNKKHNHKMALTIEKLNPEKDATREFRITGSHLGIFHNFWSNTKNTFAGDNLWYHGAAFGSTFLLATSGTDRQVQDYFQEDPLGKTYGDGALILGGIWQPIIGGALYFNSDAETKTAGSAVMQAAIIQFAYTNVLKVITGRPDPIENGDQANKQDGVCGNSSDAEAFFKFSKGCTWPSGHASSAFSLISSLYAYYPKKKWIAYWGYPTALAISVGMIENDEHWLSDIVAGALIGHVIGWTIGTNFRNDFDQLNKKQSQRPTSRYFLSPVVSSAGVGFSYRITF